MNLNIRKAGIDDIEFLMRLEKKSFPFFQRGTKQSIKHGIRSEFQEILIAETKGNIKESIGSLILFKYRKCLRIYSIAVLPNYQNKGFGDYLLKYVIEFANRLHYEKMSLEVRAKNTHLVEWYQARGFNIKGSIADYYIEDEDAIKMEFKMSAISSSNKKSNVIVINQPFKWSFSDVQIRSCPSQTRAHIRRFSKS